MKSVSLKKRYVNIGARVVVISVLVLAVAVSLFGQGNFGRILGTVTDQTGAVIAGAMVTVIDTERGLARTLITDQAGEYNAPTLIPGTYTVRVEANGFKKLERTGILLEVGKELRVDLTPQPGAQTQTIAVTEASPLVDTASATLGGEDFEVDLVPNMGKLMHQPDGLQQAVNLRGGHFRTYNSHEFFAAELNLSLADLTSKAELIVVGKIESVNSYPIGGLLVDSDYTIEVSQTLKGAPLGYSTIQVVDAGGKVVFPNGAWGEYQTVNARDMKPGREFLLFLRHNVPGTQSYLEEAPASRFTIIAQDEGVIELAGSQVIPLATHCPQADLHTHAGEVADLSSTALLERIRALLTR